MLSRSRGDYAYTVLEIKGDVPEESLNQLRAMDAVIRIRVIR